MKKNTIIYAVAILAFVINSVWAADLNGKWTGQVQEKGEGREISFDFTVAGAKLTGTVAGALSGPIQNGKINGDELSFSLNVGKEPAKRIMNFKGKVVNGEIKFTVTREGGEHGIEFTAKRPAK